MDSSVHVLKFVLKSFVSLKFEEFEEEKVVPLCGRVVGHFKLISSARRARVRFRYLMKEI